MIFYIFQTQRNAAAKRARNRGPTRGGLDHDSLTRKANAAEKQRAQIRALLLNDQCSPQKCMRICAKTREIWLPAFRI